MTAFVLGGRVFIIRNEELGISTGWDAPIEIEITARIVHGFFKHESYEFIECGSSALSSFTTNYSNAGGVGTLHCIRTIR